LKILKSIKSNQQQVFPKDSEYITAFMMLVLYSQSHKINSSTEPRGNIMKKILTSIALLALVSFSSVQATPTSYVLMCKGGGNMSVDYNSGSNKLIVNFKAGSRSGGNGISAGMCTWVDRGFRTREPHRLCQMGVNDLRFHMNSSDKITRMTSSKAPYISRLLSGQAFQVRVYNDGNGCMKVTKAGV
jgi:hypothetical protein